METTKPITDEQIVNAISHTLIKGYNFSVCCVKYLIENEVTKKNLIIENSHLHEETDLLRKEKLQYLSERNTRLQEEIILLKKEVMVHGKY